MPPGLHCDRPTLRTMMRVLVIGGEPRILDALGCRLSAEGFAVTCASAGAENVRCGLADDVDIVIFDQSVSGRDGLTALTVVRQRAPWLPVIVVSVHDDVDDRIDALDAGATDFLAKPFSFAELVARMRAQLRRADDRT